MKYIASIIALTLGTAGIQAHAQDAPPAPTSAPDAAAPNAASLGATSAAAQVSDAEVDQFAQATVKVQKIVADTTLDQASKQKQMAAAVTGVGLAPTRYNEIAQAVPSDSALRARVMTAMAKYAPPSQG